jgi:hypothetical protein
MGYSWTSAEYSSKRSVYFVRQLGQVFAPVTRSAVTSQWRKSEK